MVDRSALRKEMERISDLKDHIALHGWPDYAEVQAVVAEEPFADYEVRVYYMARQCEVRFRPSLCRTLGQDFGIKRYEGPIPTETLGRSVDGASRSTSLADPVEPESPPPPPQRRRASGRDRFGRRASARRVSSAAAAGAPARSDQLFPSTEEPARHEPAIRVGRSRLGSSRRPRWSAAADLREFPWHRSRLAASCSVDKRTGGC